MNDEKNFNGKPKVSYWEPNIYLHIKSLSRHNPHNRFFTTLSFHMYSHTICVLSSVVCMRGLLEFSSIIAPHSRIPIYSISLAPAGVFLNLMNRSRHRLSQFIHRDNFTDDGTRDVHRQSHPLRGLFEDGRRQSRQDVRRAQRFRETENHPKWRECLRSLSSDCLVHGFIALIVSFFQFATNVVP